MLSIAWHPIAWPWQSSRPNPRPPPPPPRRGSQRVVLVAGDSVGSMRIEDSVASAAIDAVLSSSARVSQFVLVSQLAGGGGGWFGLGGGSRGAKLSSLEQAVVDSADSALLLRTGKWSEDGGNSVPLATGRGGLPRGASVPVGIVAQGVVESLGLTSGDGVVEVGAGGSEEEGSLRDQIQRVRVAGGGVGMGVWELDVQEAGAAIPVVSSRHTSHKLQSTALWRAVCAGAQHIGGSCAQVTCLYRHQFW